MSGGLPSVEAAVALLTRLPGVGRKSAQRMVAHLLREGPQGIAQLSAALTTMQERVRACSRCFNLAEAELCWICADPKRQSAQLCVVEEASDLMAMERAGSFRGVYHVLGGALSPIDGVGPEDLNLGALLERMRSESIEEVIIATNPTVSGEATAHYLTAMLHGLQGVDVTVSRLAYGMPMGGELEYLDESTLYQALAGRRPL
ncbi:recombination mediator RecR [Magnetofaba australis]|uniref:Recombination protein RecR n=1 Tax=Magnetofaba australis IT-1 TaxID=1434232 RepID=A0A1Y2KCA1_9PROT|nr:recombination mediator RecR [Magnetofaba australis]OSM08470.1 putative DNA replication and repair protein RecR [Magnetofaba australis IT-1]